FGDSLAGANAAIDSIVRVSVERVRTRLERPVAVIAEDMPRRGPEFAVGNLMADAMRVMGNGDFGSWNTPGIRSDLRAGPLNFGGVHELTPFGNALVRLRVTGRNLPTLL